MKRTYHQHAAGRVVNVVEDTSSHHSSDADEAALVATNSNPHQPHHQAAHWSSEEEEEETSHYHEDAVCCASWCSSSQQKDKQKRFKQQAAHIEEEETHRYLAQEFSKLSLDQRNQATDDLHGVGGASSVIAEDDSRLVQQRLEELRDALTIQAGGDRAANSHKTGVPKAYTLAAFLSPKYVTSDRFLFAFLRADSWNVKKATQRILQHFEQKKKLFGPDLLGRDIEWQDLTEEDRECYLCGSTLFGQDLKDSTGRCIFLEYYAAWSKTAPVKSRLRSVWYTLMGGILDDVDTQLKGIVVLLYGVGISVGAFARAVVQQAQNPIADALPVRPTANHLCFDSPQLVSLFRILIQTAPPDAKHRMRLHQGSHIEVQYSLASFGIRPSILPMDGDGQIKESYVQAHHEQVLAREDNWKSQRKELLAEGIVEAATTKDVLIGRGNIYQYHPGNNRLNQLVEVNEARYHGYGDDKLAKTVLSLEILQIIQESGGRFLKRTSNNNNTWTVVEDGTAREKVSMTFRNLTRRARTKR